LVARIDDSALSAGNYVLRATAHDQAHNESSTTQRSDGQPMTVTLPLRIPSALQGGVVRKRVAKRVVRRHGKRRTIRRRVTELKPRGVVLLGRQAQISGRLANRDGQGIAGADVQVFATPDGGPQQLVGVVHTDSAGAYSYTAAGSTSRSLRFVYAGSPLILPAESTVRLVVPAASTLRVTRRRVLNGQHVTFSGQVRSVPIPGGGKLIQLEVLLSGRWQTFRTARTDRPAGGPCPIASRARAECGGTASAWNCHARPDTRLAPARRSRCASASEVWGPPFGGGASRDDGAAEASPREEREPGDQFEHAEDQRDPAPGVQAASSSASLGNRSRTGSCRCLTRTRDRSARASSASRTSSGT
jgi:hypothetical protein